MRSIGDPDSRRSQHPVTRPPELRYPITGKALFKQLAAVLERLTAIGEPTNEAPPPA